MPSFSWTDIEDIALALLDEHPQTDPLSVRFTELREMVEKLPDFAPEPDQHPNEQILEAVQAAWHEEKQDAVGDADDDEDDGPGYTPNNPFR